MIALLLLMPARMHTTCVFPTGNCRPIGITGRPKLNRDVVMEDVQSVKQIHGSMYDEGSSKASLAKSVTAAAVAAGHSALAVDPDSAVSTKPLAG